MPSGWVALAARAVRVPVRARVPAGARCRQPAREVRRADLPRRRGAASADGGRGAAAEGSARQPKAEDIPAEYRDRLGRITAEKTFPQLQEIRRRRRDDRRRGAAPAALGEHARPAGRATISSRMRRTARSGAAGDEVLHPGSILRCGGQHATRSPTACDEEARRVLRQQPGARARRRTRRSKASGRSRGSTARAAAHRGWAWGQDYLEGGAAGVEARVGKGKMLLFGPEITFRAPAARHVQVPVQQHLLRDGRRRCSRSWNDGSSLSARPDSLRRPLHRRSGIHHAATRPGAVCGVLRRPIAFPRRVP